ncbi:expressed unknown protein [Seminavis robusta]|uniref:K Homology domain-containing protein n=1 Tax=Seminavis robusta TaxID=568900 RepID=A0A9N8HFV2_9STRA|nr:expressed unknown protein [Seminavis robusta]|eukprot:Sro594_g172510.1 n/a (1025) ;mRNA; f:41099-44173
MDATFHPLPGSIAEKSTFPPGTSCLFVENLRDNRLSNFKRGTVEEVGLNFAASQGRGLLYKIIGVGDNAVFCQEEQVLFAPRTKVTITLRSADCSQQLNGIILGSSSVDDPATDDNASSGVKYELQVTRGAFTSIYANVSPQDIAYRATSTSTGSTATASAARESGKTAVAPTENDDAISIDDDDTVQDGEDECVAIMAQQPEEASQGASAAACSTKEICDQPGPKLESPTIDEPDVLKEPDDKSYYESAAPEPGSKTDLLELETNVKLSPKEESTRPDPATASELPSYDESIERTSQEAESRISLDNQHPRPDCLANAEDAQHCLEQPETSNDGFAINNQNPYPFQNICQGERHDTYSAQGLLRPYFRVKITTMWPFSDLCLNYHLNGVCKRGRGCARADSHRDLTRNAAKRMERVLAPVTSPEGPIFSAKRQNGDKDVISNNYQPNPFRRIRRSSENRIIFARSHLKQCCGGRFPLPGFCMHFHLNGICPKGHLCKWLENHRYLTIEEADEIEQVLQPVIGANGPIYAKTRSAEKNKRKLLSEEGAPQDKDMGVSSSASKRRSLTTDPKCNQSSSNVQSDGESSTDDESNARLEPDVRTTQEHEVDQTEMVGNIAYNLQPNPFDSIHRNTYNHIVNAKIRLQNYYGHHPFTGFCLHFHLNGRCIKGVHCSLAEDHRSLTIDEARQIERTLKPAIAPDGPIYSRTRRAAADGEPQSPKKRRRGNPKRRCSSHYERNPDDEDAPCSPSKRLCSTKLVDHNVSIEEQSNRRGSCTRPSNGSTVSTAEIHQAIKWTPPQLMTQQSKSKISLTLPAHTFGVDFFEKNIIGPQGTRAKHLGERFGCTVELHGKAWEHRSESPLSSADSVLHVRLTGKITDRLVDCARLIEKLLVRAMVPELRGFFMFRLSSLNQCKAGNQLVVHSPSQDKVYRVDNLATLLEGVVGEDQKYLTVVSDGPVADHKGRPLDPVVSRLKTLQECHRSCKVEICERSQAYPNIFRFITIYGSTHLDVLTCRNSIIQVAVTGT